MKRLAMSLTLLLASGTAFAQLPSQIKNVIVIFQENRTPDNLFHGLSPKCAIPPGSTGFKACTPSPVTDTCYDISPCGVSDQKTKANPNGDPVPIALTAAPLAGSFDPDHSHRGFVGMCDPDPVTLECRDDGAWFTSCKPDANGNCTVPTSSYAYVDNVPVTNYNGSKGHLLDPYLTFAKQYGWANFMYQTNQGPSYPAHQFLFAGTSAPTAADDANAVYVSENFNGKIVGNAAGCLLPSGGANRVIAASVPNSPPPDCVKFPATASCIEYPGNVFENTVTNQINTVGNEAIGTYCYPHKSMADLLDPAHVSWKYYAPMPGSIWTAPDSIQKICVPEYKTVIVNGVPTQELECTGAEWNANVDTGDANGNNIPGTQILNDIDNCNLSNVTWVIPDGRWSDHAGPDDQYGPSWVAAIVNEIGNRATCASGTKNAGQKLWDTTAIIITWDDWGGWSDNQPALYLSQLPCTGHSPCLGDYQYGFRVPMVVVSAYTPQATINNDNHDFGSILRLIEGVNHIPEGALGFADARQHNDLTHFFTLTSPRSYQSVPAQYPAKCFTATTQLQGCFPIKPPSEPDND